MRCFRQRLPPPLEILCSTQCDRTEIAYVKYLDYSPMLFAFLLCPCSFFQARFQRLLHPPPTLFYFPPSACFPAQTLPCLSHPGGFRFCSHSALSTEELSASKVGDKKSKWTCFPGHKNLNVSMVCRWPFPHKCKPYFTVLK